MNTESVRVLFLDDRSDRIRGAIRRFPPPLYDLVTVFTAKECIKRLNSERWDWLYLDYDLNFEEFVSPDSKNCSMEIVRYLEQTEWNWEYKKPTVVLHSTNMFGSRLMFSHLTELGFECNLCPWEYTKHITGIVTGAFDLIHPGYVRLFKDAKRICQHLTVALNTNGKRKPFMSVEEKTEILYSIRYVDAVVTYGSEEELDKLIPHYDIKINGSDRQGKTTRPGIDQYYHKRDHDWSTTKLIEKIKELT